MEYQQDLIRSVNRTTKNWRQIGGIRPVVEEDPTLGEIYSASHSVRNQDVRDVADHSGRAEAL
jgi:hypothetical protein